MVEPRQKLYRVGHLNFIKSLLSGRISRPPVEGFRETLAKFLNVPPKNIVLLPRGRMALYFAVKQAVKAGKPQVLMSPFTIYDMVNMVKAAGGEPVFFDSAAPPHADYADLEPLISDITGLVVITHYHTSNANVDDIARKLKRHNIALFEDAAIALGARNTKKLYGTIGDYGLFSFGLFKFISTYFGGAMYVRDSDTASEIETELNAYKIMSARDLAPYAAKGLKFSLATQKLLFRMITFPIFKFGYINDITPITDQAKNDPNPKLIDTLPASYRRRPNNFQVSEWTRQLDYVEADRKKRLEIANIYASTINNTKISFFQPNPEKDCFLNFPILVDDRDVVISTIMREGFDVSPYFYRVLSNEEGFRQFGRDLASITNFEKKLVLLPCYPSLPKHYATALSETLNRI